MVFSAGSKMDTVYLAFNILDLGQGLSNREKKNPFQNFSRVSSKTFTHYGGSGLEPFIYEQHMDFWVSYQDGRDCSFPYVKTQQGTDCAKIANPPLKSSIGQSGAAYELVAELIICGLPGTSKSGLSSKRFSHHRHLHGVISENNLEDQKTALE